jgi:hypothetical protein
MSICSNEEPTVWQLVWAPTTVVALIVMNIFVVKVWRSARAAATEIDRSD